MTLDEPPTPYLVVDADGLEDNLTAMADSARRTGVALRPHAKTHKSLDIARRQQRHGAAGLTVATVSEAEVFAAGGCTDLFLAYPLWTTPVQGRRLRRLLDRALLRIGIDSVEGARALASEVGGGTGLTVLVEIDSGHHRSGVPPDAAGDLALAAGAAGLDVLGLFTFPGHSYAPGERAAVARQEAQALTTAVASLAAHGLTPRVVSGGSTPSVEYVEGQPLTEIRPGVYAFGDAQQWELGTIGPESIALTCHATVVSTVGGRVILDSGSKALGADRPAWTTGSGRLLDHPDARVGLVSEHHAVVSWDASPLPALGERLRVVPNHVCTAVNLTDELHVARDGVLVDRWPVAARGANT